MENEKKGPSLFSHLPHPTPRGMPEETLVLELGMALRSVCVPSAEVLGKGRQWRMYLGSGACVGPLCELGTGHVRVRVRRCFGLQPMNRPWGPGGHSHL